MKNYMIFFLFIILLIILINVQCKNLKVFKGYREIVKININVSTDEKYEIAKEVVENVYKFIKEDLKEKFSKLKNKDLDNLIFQYPIKVYDDERAEKSTHIVIVFKTQNSKINPKDITDYCAKIIREELEKYNNISNK